MIREPAVAGSFYPASADELKRMIEINIAKAKNGIDKFIGAVVPHAGYVFCAHVAAYAYAHLAAFDTAIIIGPNHYSIGASPAVSLEDWRTPLGIIKCDTELAKGIGVVADETAHKYEHSIEVQLPWLQCLYNGKKFLAISVKASDFNIKTCKWLGEKIAQAAISLDRKIVILASSDFTHHGITYGYTPFGNKVSQVIKGMKDIDMNIAKYIENIMPEKVIDECKDKNLTICGYGCISTMLWAIKKMGAKEGSILKYATSFDVSRDISAVVGYCAIGLK